VLLLIALNENKILFPEIVVETVVWEFDCKYNVADVSENDEDEVNWTKEFALIALYSFTYIFKLEGVNGV